MIGHPSRYTVYAGDRGVFDVEAFDKRHAVALIVARLGLSEEDATAVASWAVTGAGSRPPKPAVVIPPLSGYTVFARGKGRYRVEAHNRRHAVAAVVARLGISEREAKAVSSWSVTCEKDLNNRKGNNNNQNNNKKENAK